MCFGKVVPLVKASRTRGGKKNIFYTMKSCQFENAAFWGFFIYFFLEAAFWSLRRNSEGADRLARQWDYPFLSREKVTEQTELYPDQNCFGPPSLATWMYNSRFKYFYTVFCKLFSETSLLNYCWIYFNVLCKLREEAPLLKKHKRASQQRKAFSLF